MQTPPPHPSAILIVAALNGCPLATVELRDGRRVRVHNVAWGQDLGDPEYHITTNISPAPSAAHCIDVFSTADVLRIVDAQTQAILFDRASPSKRDR
jgi:hypothetical protein